MDNPAFGAIFQQLNRLRQELNEISATGDAGAGLVRVTIDGRGEARKVEISEELLREDLRMLEDLVAAAVTDACQRLKTAREEELRKALGGIPLPPGLNLPF